MTAAQLHKPVSFSPGAQVLDDKSFRIMLIALQAQLICLVFPLAQQVSESRFQRQCKCPRSEDQNFQKKGSPSGAGPDQATKRYRSHELRQRHAKAKLPRDDMQEPGWTVGSRAGADLLLFAQALRMVAHQIYITALQTRAAGFARKMGNASENSRDQVNACVSDPRMPLQGPDGVLYGAELGGQFLLAWKHSGNPSAHVVR